MTRKSILFVTPNFGREFGGVGASAERIVGHLRADYDVTVFVPERTFTSGQVVRESQLGLEIVRFGSNSDARIHHQFCCDLIIEEARRRVAHAVCSFYVSGLAYGTALAAKLLNLPLIAFARGNDIDLDFFGAESHHIQYVLSNAAQVMCVSSEMKAKIDSWVPTAKSCYVPNGVDEVDFSPLESTPSLSKPVIGLFGEIKSKKGLGLLLEAIDFQNYSLEITGRVDSESARLLHGVLTLHPEYQEFIKVIPFLKRHIELLEQYKKVDIVCIPSMHDGMPNVLLEALSCGKIVVASDVGGALDVIEDGKNGFLFQRGNIASLKEALGKALTSKQDPDSQILTYARAVIVEQFSWRHEKQRYREIFQEIL